MTHVVTENCIKCKYTDCVEVFPGRRNRISQNDVLPIPAPAAGAVDGLSHESREEA